MGATDVLPYPRRRSSVQINATMNNTFNYSTPEPKTPTVLSPLRVLPRDIFNNEPTRSKSIECLFRVRSHSLHRSDRTNPEESRRPSIRNERPHEARRRPRLASDQSENAAQYIERLRRELIVQIRQPHECNYVF
ncbi:unnamed protein product [Angiostrongylus costaricensis]|uniref:Uncharacterized protein n=1 Tax=Angiostrongylus costaricensis TaxID=334426 RepID=A0A0R3PA62_ANGCS|nr:unnamed protein product [Angiostrongylus costaricensis]